MEKMKTLAIGDYVFEIVDDAARNDISNLSGQIADQQTAIDGKQPNGNYALKSEIPTVPVQSVNGKTGAVVLSANDVGATTKDYVDSEITDLKAQGVQQAPLFATTLEDCTDATKVYVLPDGYIYGKIKKAIVPYTNQIPISVDKNKQPYVGTKGEIGYEKDCMLIMSTGELNFKMSTASGTSTTGFIPIKKGDVLHFQDYDYKPGADGGSQRGIVLYKSDFSYFTGIIPSSASNFGYLVTFTSYDSGYVKTMTIVDKYNDKLAYLRFSAPNVHKAIITINEEIVDPIYDYVWTNTGHAFVPQDCEERIIPLEEDVESHESRIKALEMYGSDSTSDDSIPAYIKTESDSVMNRLIAKQGNCVFNFIALSDFHYGGQGDNKDNLIRACKAISYIQGRMHIDAVATLGDNLPYGSDYSESLRTTADRWNKEVNEILAITQKPGVIDFRTPGNHDRFGTTEQYMPDNAIYSFIGGYNRQCDYVNAPIGYAYRDFEGYKLRVIVLNTAETEGRGRFSEDSGYYIGNNQYKWLIKTLDMSSKEDASEWQVLILSHHRADDWQKAVDGSSNAYNGYILPNILNAYKKGSSYSATIVSENISVSCNFAGKNQARLIGHIHGHHHDYEYNHIALGSINNSDLTSVLAISTPTTSFVTNGNKDNAGNTYSSVKDTAQETAFCVYSIDLDNHKIHAIHYGNGVDREISY